MGSQYLGYSVRQPAEGYNVLKPWTPRNQVEHGLSVSTLGYSVRQPAEGYNVLKPWTPRNQVEHGLSVSTLGYSVRQPAEGYNVLKPWTPHPHALTTVMLDIKFVKVNML